jgi:hypothetical protein
MKKTDTEAILICRPYITLRNGKVLWAWEKGMKAFCFPASPNYISKKLKTSSEIDSEEV